MYNSPILAAFTMADMEYQSEYANANFKRGRDRTKRKKRNWLIPAAATAVGAATVGGILLSNRKKIPQVFNGELMRDRAQGLLTGRNQALLTGSRNQALLTGAGSRNQALLPGNRYAPLWSRKNGTVSGR